MQKDVVVGVGAYLVLATGRLGMGVATSQRFIEEESIIVSRVIVC